jgi:hypothetical protein
MMKKTQGDLVSITPILLLMAKTSTSSPDPAMHNDGPVKNQIKVVVMA